MKKRICLLLMGMILYGAFYAQETPNSNATIPTQANGNTRWKLDGNMLEAEKFIGTINEKDLIFKSNSQEALRLTPDKKMIIPGQVYMDLHRPIDPGKENILTIDHNGLLKGMETDVLAKALYSDPCYFTKDDFILPVWANIEGTTMGGGILYTGANCAPAKVGIGTDNPLSRLHVVGGIIGSEMALGTSDFGNAHLTILEPSKSKGGILINLTNQEDYFNSGVGVKTIVNNANTKAMTVEDGASNKDVFRIYGSGLIETYLTESDYGLVIHDATNDNKKIFEVLKNGTVFANELKITLNPFPDYVFEKSYELLPIEQLKNYIEENGSLPNMPNQEQVKEEGVGVGELQLKLVEKVEELTLYVIELNEKIEGLTKDNDALKIRKDQK